MTSAIINGRCASLEKISKKKHVSVDPMSGKYFMKSTDLTWVLELGNIVIEKANIS